MKRLFSRKEKQAVELVTGRQGEADHIIPYSAGGKTEVENCQLMSGELNKKKGAFNYVPRGWQSEFMEAWDKREDGRAFMLIAIPGGGKTMAALEVARRWTQAGVDRRIVVVVPTDNLRDQWSEEAERFGFSLQTKEFMTNFKDGFRGGVTTYQSVAGNSLIFKKLCSVAPTMVIFDEIHHCGESAQFGIGVKEAFLGAKEKLLLSGTPWKTDGSIIPFVRYDGNGFAVGDFSYDYPNALNDNVVRWLNFEHARGVITNELNGDIQVVSSDISEEEAQQRLRRLLDPDGDYVREQIYNAHRKLMKLRESKPDAAGLAACIDMYHAQKVADVIRDVTGCNPSVIVSDGEIENDTIKRFRFARTEWLVAVRKVSEGTDIKRLQVLCYLTNTTSELFFRQLVGRVSRVEDKDDSDAYVYLPADPRLVRCAENIENAQVQALREQSERDARDSVSRQEVLDFGVYSTSHEGADVTIVAGERVMPEHYHALESIAENIGIPLQKLHQAYKELMNLHGVSRPSVSTPQEPAALTKEQRMDGIRTTIKHIVGMLSRKYGVDHKFIHGRFSPQKDMSEQELIRKREILLGWLSDYENGSRKLPHA